MSAPEPDPAPAPAADDPPRDRDGDGDLTITALYTSGTWAWAGFKRAELFATREGGAVFTVTNVVMAFASLLRPGSPSLRWSLAQRHAMIDQLARNTGATRIVELAAGLSRRGAAFTDDPAVRYVEVDLPAVIARKDELLARTETGRAVAGRSSLVRLAADVRDVDLGAVVGQVTDGDPPGTRVCVIAEGLMMYLDARAQRALWGRIAEALAGRPGSVLLFDLVPAGELPQPGLVGRALGALMAWFTDGRGFVRDGRARADLRRDLVQSGFSEVDLFEPTDFGPDAPLPGRGRRTQVVVFRCGVS